jgi:hypothetical protein
MPCVHYGEDLMSIVLPLGMNRSTLAIIVPDTDYYAA